MISRARLFILALIILLVAALSLAVGVSYLLKKERAINLSQQNELEEIKTRQRITEAKLDESRKIIAKLEVNLGDAKTQINKLNSGLEAEKSLKQEVLAQVEQLRSDLTQQQALRLDLENRLTKAQEEAKNMDARLWQLQVQRTELEVKIKSLEAKAQPTAQPAQAQGVELGKIVVGTEAAATEAAKQPVTEKKQAKKKVKKEKPAKVKPEKKKPEAKKQVPAAKEEKVPSGPTGSVLVVNKDYDFLVISLGSKEGVATGDTFSVFHGNKYLGDVKVEKIHDSMSAAGFLSPDIKDKVSEGDKVVKKTE